MRLGGGVALAAMCALGALLRFVELGHQSFWFRREGDRRPHARELGHAAAHPAPTASPPRPSTTWPHWPGARCSVPRAGRAGTGDGRARRLPSPAAAPLPTSERLPHRRGRQRGEVDVVTASSPRHRGCWWGAACNLPVLAAPLTPPAPGFTLTGERRSGLWDVLSYRAPTPVVVSPQQLLASAPGDPPSPRAELYLQHR